MKYIQIPEDIEVEPWAAIKAVNPQAQSERLSFFKYAESVWLDDQRAVLDGATASLTKTYRWKEVYDKFKAAKAGSTVAVDDQDYETLKVIVNAPSKLMPMAVTFACIPFSKAVLDASSEPPS